MNLESQRQPFDADQQFAEPDMAIAVHRATVTIARRQTPAPRRGDADCGRIRRFTSHTPQSFGERVAAYVAQGSGRPSGESGVVMTRCY